MKKIFLVLIVLICIFSANQTLASLSISPLKFEFDVNKNSQIQEKIKITNNGSGAITLYSSTEDFIAGDDTGTPKFIKPEEQQDQEHSLSKWIEVEDKNITLAPGESREVLFVVNIPETTEPGGHYAAIFFSPGVPEGAQVAVVQRLGVLVLINVPGEVKVEGNLKSFKIGQKGEKELKEGTTFSNFPIIFQTIFENTGNVHLKPKGKITLIDENGEELKNIGKEVITSPAGAYIGEQMVDYIPINETLGNVLPKSERRFETNWEGFGYSVLNNDGTKSVFFKNLEEYYAEKATEKAQFLMPWESINTRTVNKVITAKFELSYEGKNKEKKDFLDSKNFTVTYKEKYIGFNYMAIGIIGIILLGILSYFIFIMPKQKAKKEEELRKKIMEEMTKK